MIGMDYRQNINAVLDLTPTSETAPAVDVITFPDHIQCYEKAAAAMDRKAHELINTARSHTPLFPPKPPKQAVTYFAPKVIQSAIIPTTEPNDTIPIMLNEGIASPYEARLMVSKNAPFQTIISYIMNDDDDVLAVLGKSHTLNELVTAMRTMVDTDNVTLKSVMMLVNRQYTRIINEYLQAIVDTELQIDSFLDDYEDLIDHLENSGFVWVESTLVNLTTGTQLIDMGQLEDSKDIYVSATNVMYLDKTAEDMGFMEITNEFFVMLSNVYHPTLITVLDRAYGYGHKIPVTVIVLKDDTYLAYKSCVPGGTWGITRV